MISFKQFLHEAEVHPMAPPIPIEPTLLRKQLEKHCSNALKSYNSGGMVLYRGWTSRPSTGIMNPSSGTRQSENTSNFYTTFFDTNPANAKWPKRSKALICSTSESRAESYANNDDDLTMVFPFDGVEIAEVMTDDLWEVVPSASVNAVKRRILPNFNRFWSRILDVKIPPTYQEALSILEDVDNDILEARFKHQLFQDGVSPAVEDSYAKRIEQDPDFLRDMLLSDFKKMYTFDDQANWYQLRDSMLDVYNDNHEVWFSGECIIVPYNDWKFI